MQEQWWTVACLAVCLSTSGVFSFVVVVDKPESLSRHARDAKDGAPSMTKLEIDSNILYRYARTSVASRLVNNAEVAREISFNVVLPQSAFISAFHIELNGSIYNAYVKEKEEAKKEYSQAVSQGWTAAKVEHSVRDSSRFAVSVNVEASAKVTFNLTYEELLTRRLETYNHVINIDPGQIVPELNVRVRIEESNTLTSLRVPTLRVSNEVDAGAGDSERNDPLVVIERPADNIALITWSPTPDQQHDLRDDGVQGQLTVQYDVERQGNSSQILVSDGYFVHFYAPVDLEPLKKHVVLVLDVSGSMSGTKMQQLKSAMTTVLGDLQDGDYFSIVIFSSDVNVWLPSLRASIEVDLRSKTELTSNFIVPVNPENIRLAKEYVDSLHALSATNIYDALMVGLELVKLGQTTLESMLIGYIPEPMIVFLTDGQANEGQSNHDVIVRDVTQRNKRQTAIFTLCFGHDADKEFLKKLSLKNSAFSRLIYEGSDAALQLEDFYRQVSSPLLANVTFSYEADQVTNNSLTAVHFNTLFRGAELVVAGKMAPGNERLRGVLMAKSLSGKSRYGFPEPMVLRLPSPVNQSAPGFMEKLWAHLNIQQLLDKEKTEEGETSPSKTRALQLALKYSFVTPLTSLVVVKPNETSRADAVDAALPELSHSGLYHGSGVYPGSSVSSGSGFYPVSAIGYSGSGFYPGSSGFSGHGVIYTGSGVLSGSGLYPGSAIGYSGSGGSSGLSGVSYPGSSVSSGSGFYPGSAIGYSASGFYPGSAIGYSGSSGSSGHGVAYTGSGELSGSGIYPGSAIGYPASGFYPGSSIKYSGSGGSSGTGVAYPGSGVLSGAGLYPGSAIGYPGSSGSSGPGIGYPGTGVAYPGSGVSSGSGHYPGSAVGYHGSGGSSGTDRYILTGTFPSSSGNPSLTGIPASRGYSVGSVTYGASGPPFSRHPSSSGIPASSGFPTSSGYFGASGYASTTTSSPRLTLSDLRWPSDVYNSSHVTVTLTNGGVRTLTVGVNEMDISTNVSAQCGLNGSGPCRHLQYCVLPEFVTDFSVYQSSYFCDATGGFAGVCCPDNY